MTTLPSDTSLKLVLGSGSPRRLELLAQLGLTPSDIRPPDIDEDVRKGELPRDYVNRIATEKAAAVNAAENEVVLCADTTVALGRRIDRADQLLPALTAALDTGWLPDVVLVITDDGYLVFDLSARAAGRRPGAVRLRWRRQD